MVSAAMANVHPGPDSDLRVTLIQSDLVWHDPEKNRQAFADRISELEGETDLILLPEMFTSGFTTDVDGFESQGSPTTDWMLQQSQLSGAALCGSTVFSLANAQQNGSHHANRCLFARSSGELQHYDKTHLFRMAGEHERYVAGDKRVIVEYKGWRILLLVCYDIRFPVFCRNRQDYDLAVCVANWPAARRQPWRILLQARAMENLAYVAGVNRVGLDGNDIAYSGDSLLFDCKGDVMIDHPADQQFVETATLSASHLAQFRDKFQAWRDADQFELKSTAL